MWQFFRTLFQHALAQSRSSAINPLQWALFILVVATVGLTLEPRTPPWLLVSAACAAGADLLLLFVAYVFFMVTAPDALRSEKFSLAKTAMEKRYLGDNLTGLREVMDSFDDTDKKALGPASPGAERR